MNVPLTPIRFLRYAREQFPDKTAVICDDKRFTYREFSDRAMQLAGALLAAGAAPGDRIAFLSTNCHRLLEAYYGVLEAGCVLLPLNVRLSPADLANILEDAAARFLFFESRFLPLVDRLRHAPGAPAHFVLLDENPDATWMCAHHYDDLLAHSQPAEHELTTMDEDSLAELFYTSGTDDKPKGVMLTHRNVYLHALSVIMAMQTAPSTAGLVSCREVELHTIPLFHANGWGAAHAITVVGGTHVMIHQFVPEQVFSIIEKERVTSCCLVPAMALALIHSPLLPRFDLSSLRRVVFGGAASSPTLVREVQRKLGGVCFSGYGLTETSPVLATSQLKVGLEVATDDERCACQAKTGYSVPGVELRVVDADGKEVPREGTAVGEIVVRGDGVMAGYWRQPEATKAAMSGGWFHTGDLATMDQNNYVLVVDRKKDIIVSGGENISSLEIEKTLAVHPSVYEAAVIPIPDVRWGEAAHALVIRKPSTSTTEAELMEFCRTRLARYKCPKSIEFTDALPRSGTGKISKHELRKRYWPAKTVAGL